VNKPAQIAIFVGLLLAAFPVSGQGPITVLKDFGDDSLLGGMVQVQDGTFFGVGMCGPARHQRLPQSFI